MPPTVVDVRVRGSSGALEPLAAGELVAVLDLRAGRARAAPVPPDRRRRARAVRRRGRAGARPRPSRCTFEPSATKTVPVSPVLEGEPARRLRGATRSPRTRRRWSRRVRPAPCKTLIEAITEPSRSTGADDDRDRSRHRRRGRSRRVRLTRSADAVTCHGRQSVPVRASSHY